MNNAEAFAALKKAGLKHDDPDLVRLFDLNAQDFVAAAKKAKPDFFEFDAMTASSAEVAARLRAMNEAASRDRFAARASDTLAQLQARYGADGMAGATR